MHILSSTRAASLVMAFALIAFHAPLALGAEAAPTVDTLKQALERRLLSLKPGGMTERQVLFEEVRAGKPSGGTYPFQVTASIRDYGPGYPANNFYGETCVGRMEKWSFELSRDAFGEWQVQGRMTITGPGQCKRNPAARVSSIPLASLSGSAAPAAAVAPKGPAAPKPQNAAAAGAASGAKNGSYECWFFTSPRPGLNFTLQGGGRYLDSEKKAGSYTNDAGKLSFKGGALDGQSAVYHEPRGKPTVSFRNSQSREIAFCELAPR